MNPIAVTCPACHAEFPLADKEMKAMVKRELLSADPDDFDAPVRNFLHTLLDGDGAKQLVHQIRKILRSKSSSALVKLRALEIIASCMKHHEKQSPKPFEITSAETPALESFIDKKLGLTPDPKSSTPTLRQVPGWMQAIDETQTQKR